VRSLIRIRSCLAIVARMLRTGGLTGFFCNADFEKFGDRF
jgi:hypothetical protein